jgi:hypothetical protein
MNACSSQLSATDPAFSSLPSRKCSVHAGDGYTLCGFVWAGTCDFICRRGSCVSPAVDGPGTEVINVYLERNTEVITQVTAAAKTPQQ